MDREENKSLISEVFSWLVQKILNKDIFKERIRTIPDKFWSVDEYLNCFVPHLLEETRTELCSSLGSLSKAPVFYIRSLEARTIKETSRRSNHFNISLKGVNVKRNNTIYETKCGDLIALTEAGRPRSVNDLNPLVLAYVFSVEDETHFSVHSSVSISIDERFPFGSGVFLMTLTTNTRIWKALHYEGGNMSLIKSVLQANTEDTEHSVSSRTWGNNVRDLIRSTNLNASQESAVLSFLETRTFSEKTSVKLIWGPPGTGKTKTVATLLFALLNLGCKTVVCAPTNTAVVGVASRLLALVKESSPSGHSTYGLGNIVLSGNRVRMGIDSKNNDLLDVFLEHRISKLSLLLSGWELSLSSFVDFLEKAESNYKTYVLSSEKKKGEDKRSFLESFGEFVKKMFYGSSQELHKKKEKILTFGEFIRNEFHNLSQELVKVMDHMEHHVVDMYTHLPKSFIPSNDVKNMITARRALHHARSFLKKNSSKHDFEIRSFVCYCLEPLRLLPKRFRIPTLLENEDGMRFCLQNACIIFCTVSGASQMTVERTASIELLVVDEAAQLKECESVAALQLQGLRHVVLIGDELQLPAMVQSKKAKFGRSLFERLVLLGHNKHLLDVQYRMHPSISLFPNMEFYDRKISDAAIVKERNYQKRFLQGNMFGSFSFINVGLGKEEFGDGNSPKNMVETKTKMNVGVISPYKGQTRAIQERIGDKYNNVSDQIFTLNVRSVDGFQGGEEDVIIISTHSLVQGTAYGWLGTRGLLTMSGSVWTKLVRDSKRRGCIYDAVDDKNLRDAMNDAMLKVDMSDAFSSFSSLSIRRGRMNA
ncbi:hypothetical protein Bca101_031130 [Brassica carinata]